jgi:hypothetical protein
MQKAAVEHFACQDGKVGLTVQCEDTFGNEHTILHRFWSNSKYVQPLMSACVYPVTKSSTRSGAAGHYNGSDVPALLALAGHACTSLRVWKVCCGCIRCNAAHCPHAMMCMQQLYSAAKPAVAEFVLANDWPRHVP